MPNPQAASLWKERNSPGTWTLWAIFMEVFILFCSPSYLTILPVNSPGAKPEGREFPGGPVVGTQRSLVRELRSHKLGSWEPGLGGERKKKKLEGKNFNTFLSVYGETGRSEGQFPGAGPRRPRHGPARDTDAQGKNRGLVGEGDELQTQLTWQGDEGGQGKSQRAWVSVLLLLWQITTNLML